MEGSIEKVPSLSQTKMSIQIDNQRLVSATNFGLSLASLGSQYKTFLKTQSLNESEKNELEISEIRAGSICVDVVVPITQLFLPFVQDSNSLFEFGKYLKNTLDFFIGKVEKSPKELAIQDCNEIHDIINPIAKDNGSNMVFNIHSNGDTILNFGLNSVEANAMQNNINQYKAQLLAPISSHKNKVVLFWSQAKFNNRKGNVDKAIIESISPEPIKVIFDNDLIKKEMTSYNSGIKKEWQELAYIVDVEIGTVNEKVKTYKILKYYPEETFDPME